MKIGALGSNYYSYKGLTNKAHSFKGSESPGGGESPRGSRVSHSSDSQGVSVSSQSNAQLKAENEMLSQKFADLEARKLEIQNKKLEQRIADLEEELRSEEK